MTTTSRLTSRSTTLSLQGVSITTIPMLKSYRYRRRYRLCRTFKTSISLILVYRSLAIVTLYLKNPTLLLLRNHSKQLS
jgi:hypothetical protein